MRKTKRPGRQPKLKAPLPEVRELDPGDPRLKAYKQQRTAWQRRNVGATAAKTQAAWNQIAKGLGVRPTRLIVVKDERFALPVQIPPEQIREWTLREVSRVKRRLRSGAPVPWKVTDATGNVTYEQRPLSPPPPHRGGRPLGSYRLTDAMLQAALVARGLHGRRPSRQMQIEIATELGFNIRTVQRHLKELLG